jgi:putative phosphonate metabolism protein
MRDRDEDRRADGTLKPLSEQAAREVARPAPAVNAAPVAAHRFAAYLAPAPDSTWWKAGSSWLGRDAATNDVLSQPLIPGVSMSMQQRVTAAPRRYGWHATLRAPFALAHDADAVMLRGRLSALCRERRPFSLPLRVALLGDFLALVPDGDTRDIDALARSCVSHLHALAAPLSDAELARRRASGLTPDEDKLLVRWGYPYVMEQFRLHFSLTGPLRDVAPDTIDALKAAAEQWFAPVPPLRVDAVSLFVEPAPGADFIFTDRMDLGE